MTKSQERRSDKIAESLSTAQRICAVLDATADEKDEVIKNLYATAPIHSYRMTDNTFGRAIMAAEIFSLRTDRTFFHNQARRWKALALMSTGEWCDPEEPEPENWREDPLSPLIDQMTLVRACELLAARVGLELRQVLAFSVAFGDEDWEHARQLVHDERDSLKDAVDAAAAPITEKLLEIWQSYGGYCCGD
jgi:hypothetical protein